MPSLQPLDEATLKIITRKTITFAIWLAFACLLSIAGGCATLEQPPTTVTVKVQVPVPCINKRVERPTFTLDALSEEEIAQAAKLNDYRLLMTLYDERKQRQAYEAQVEAQLKTCSEITNGTTPLRQ